jgi:DNA-binding beta-propeller fold protein YncE
VKRVCLVVAATVLLAAPAIAQVLDTIYSFPDTVGRLTYPRQLLYNPVSGAVYHVADGGDVRLFDPSTGLPIRTFRGWYNCALYYAPLGRVYLTRIEDNQIELVAVDAAADTVVRVTVTQSSDAVLALAASDASGRLYHECGSSLAVVDPGPDTLVAEVAVEGTISRLLHDSVRDHLVILSSSDEVDSSYASVLDCSTNAVVGSAALDGLVVGAALDQGRNRLFLTVPDELLELDLASLTVLRRFSLDEATEVIYDPVLDRVCCVCNTGDGLGIVVVDSIGVRATVALPEDADVAVLGCNPVTGAVYVGFVESPGLALIDAGDTVRQWLSLPDSGQVYRAFGIAPERGELYAAQYEDTVSIVVLAADTIAAKVSYPYYNIRNLVFNPAGRKLYALCRDSRLILVVNAAGQVTARIPVNLASSDAKGLLVASLNRLLIADDDWLWIVDCNDELLIDSVPVPDMRESYLVLVPELAKVVLFRIDRPSLSYWCVYDCLRGSLSAPIMLPHEVYCAAYHPRSGMVYFAMDNSPNVGVLDPRSDSVVRLLQVGTGSSGGAMVANAENGQLYIGSSRIVYALDVASDSIVAVIPVASAIDSMLWSRTSRKVYTVNWMGYGHSIIDCETNTLLDTIGGYVRRVGLVNERSDRLYLANTSGVRVLDCQTDSVVAEIPVLYAMRLAAWDAISNRVYMAPRGNQIAVLRDDAPGVEGPLGARPALWLRVAQNPAGRNVTLCWQVPADDGAVLILVDVLGRPLVERSVSPGRGSWTWDLRDAARRSVPTGVCFARLGNGPGAPVAKVVVQR